MSFILIFKQLTALGEKMALCELHEIKNKQPLKYLFRNDSNQSKNINTYKFKHSHQNENSKQKTSNITCNGFAT